MKKIFLQRRIYKRNIFGFFKKPTIVKKEPEVKETEKVEKKTIPAHRFNLPNIKHIIAVASGKGGGIPYI